MRVPSLHKVKVLPTTCSAIPDLPSRDHAHLIYYYPAIMASLTCPQKNQTYSHLRAFELAPSARNALPADIHMASSLNFLLAFYSSHLPNKTNSGHHT